MTEFISIKDAKEAMKGNIFGTVTKIGALKSDTNAKGDWIMKIITFDDGSDTLEIAAFNEQIAQFELGSTYEVVNPWWKKNKDDKLSVALGQFATVERTQRGTKQAALEPEPKLKSPEIDIALKRFICKENLLLQQISQVIAETESVGEIVGMRTKEIYRQFKQPPLYGRE